MTRVRRQKRVRIESVSRRNVRAGAFTLVELLVVISIIALLVTMLMPSLVRGVELARRASCKANLREIARACNTYAQDKRMHLGRIPRALPTSNPTTSNWNAGGSANRESLQLLVEHGILSPDSLVCRSVDREDYDTLANGDPSAYSFISMVGRTLTVNNYGNGRVIAADRNPRFGPNQKVPISGMSHSNSLSHKTPGTPADGQNTVRLDESVKWITEPKVATGSNSNDWIYESTSGSDSGGQAAGLDDVLLLN